MKRDVFVYINDILKSIKLIKSYSKGKSLKSISKRIKDQDAILRRLEIIGEAAKSIPEEIKSKYPQINFKEFANMRDFFSHVYFGVNIERVYLLIKRDLPIFEKQLKKIKKDLSTKRK
jgi:uncharacterized protein with HEPN domain